MSKDLELVTTQDLFAELAGRFDASAFVGYRNPVGEGKPSITGLTASVEDIGGFLRSAAVALKHAGPPEEKRKDGL